MQLDDMKREFRDISNNLTGCLRVGFPSERIIYMLPLILPSFKERYPGIEVEVISGPDAKAWMSSLRMPGRR